MMHVFTCDGEEWVAWRSGGEAYGTGVCGLGNVDAIHFARSTARDVPLFEALIATGRFESLYDEELVQLFREARRVVDPADLPARPISRRGAGLS
ncbi:MAG: hypothetical protein ACT4O1_08985 [Gemmatimonadota bacterium]